MAWSGLGRRLTRFVFFWLGIIVALPLVVGLLLALSIGGWTSVAIVIVCWLGLAVLMGMTLRFGLGAWRPVRSLIETAGKLSDGDYSARVEASDSAAVRPVVKSFNRMAEQLERSETDRRRLLADVGHELRTPLTIIRGELEAMVDGVRRPGEAELRGLLEDIAVMEHLLHDLQTLSTAEAGMLQIHREQTEIVRLVEEVVERHRAAASTAGVTLLVTASADHPTIDADVDPVRVREILTNVVTNAIRATPDRGTVDVSIDRGRIVATTDPAGRHGGGQDHDAVSIKITDTGHGLSTEDAERVFERFHKGPESHGSGLGLTISRNLVLAHRGEMALDSRLGVGTTVSILLPLT